MKDNSEAVTARKVVQLFQLPRILVLHLKRFSYTLNGTGKIHKPINYMRAPPVRPPIAPPMTLPMAFQTSVHVSLWTLNHPILDCQQMKTWLLDWLSADTRMPALAEVSGMPVLASGF